MVTLAGWCDVGGGAFGLVSIVQMGGIVVSADVVRIRLYAVFPTSILPAFFLRLLRQVLNGAFLV